MKKLRSTTLVLYLSAVLLLGAAPVIAHAQDAAAATTTTTATTTVKKTAAKKPVAKTAHHKTKKKTSSTTTKKKVVSKTTSVKKTVVASKATPVVLSAPSPVHVETPTMTTTASAHPRSMAEMAKPPATKGGAPKQVVQTFYDSLLGAMKQADTLGFNGRSEKMQALLDSSFNVNDMMRTAAGPAWGTASATQQQQLVQGFRTFTAATYASRFSKYGGEQFQIIDEKPGLAANETIVETQLVEGSGDKTDLNYLLRKDSAGRWKIVDVYVDGTISEMAARRSEFGSVLRRDGVDALLKLMDEKSRSLASS